jgi:DDE superfamily endonuclease
VVAGERDRPDVARRRAQWTKYQDRVEPERLVFIDETWTRTDMAPLRGWAARGHRLTAKVPHGRWKTMTFLAALRYDRVDAPWFIEGPIDGESFRTYLEKVLLPTLRPGDIVVLDNLGSHRGKAVRQGTVRNLVFEAILMKFEGASNGYREGSIGSATCRA